METYFLQTVRRGMKKTKTSYHKLNVNYKPMCSRYDL